MTLTRLSAVLLASVLGVVPVVGLSSSAEASSLPNSTFCQTMQGLTGAPVLVAHPTLAQAKSEMRSLGTLGAKISAGLSVAPSAGIRSTLTAAASSVQAVEAPVARLVYTLTQLKAGTTPNGSGLAEAAKDLMAVVSASSSLSKALANVTSSTAPACATYFHTTQAYVTVLAVAHRAASAAGANNSLVTLSILKGAIGALPPGTISLAGAVTSGPNVNEAKFSVNESGQGILVCVSFPAVVKANPSIVNC